MCACGAETAFLRTVSRSRILFSILPLNRLLAGGGLVPLVSCRWLQLDLRNPEDESEGLEKSESSARCCVIANTSQGKQPLFSSPSFLPSDKFTGHEKVEPDLSGRGVHGCPNTWSRQRLVFVFILIICLCRRSRGESAGLPQRDIPFQEMGFVPSPPEPIILSLRTELIPPLVSHPLIPFSCKLITRITFDAQHISSPSLSSS